MTLPVAAAQPENAGIAASRWYDELAAARRGQRIPLTAETIRRGPQRPGYAPLEQLSSNMWALRLGSWAAIVSQLPTFRQRLQADKELDRWVRHHCAREERAWMGGEQGSTRYWHVHATGFGALVTNSPWSLPAAMWFRRSKLWAELHAVPRDANPRIAGLVVATCCRAGGAVDRLLAYWRRAPGIRPSRRQLALEHYAWVPLAPEYDELAPCLDDELRVENPVVLVRGTTGHAARMPFARTYNDPMFTAAVHYETGQLFVEHADRRGGGASELGPIPFRLGELREVLVIDERGVHRYPPSTTTIRAAGLTTPCEPLPGLRLEAA